MADPSTTIFPSPLGVFATLPSEILLLIGDLRGVASRLSCLSRRMYMIIESIISKKRLLPITGQETASYLTRLIRDANSIVYMNFIALILPKLTRVYWHIKIFITNTRKSVLADDVDLRHTQPPNLHTNVRRERRKEGFTYLCNSLQSIETLLPSYIIGVEILKTRFRAKTPRLQLHNLYCMFVRRCIDSVLDRMHLDHRCIFPHLLLPDSFTQCLDKAYNKKEYKKLDVMMEEAVNISDIPNHTPHQRIYELENLLIVTSDLGSIEGVFRGVSFVKRDAVVQNCRFVKKNCNELCRDLHSLPNSDEFVPSRTRVITGKRLLDFVRKLLGGIMDRQRCFSISFADVKTPGTLYQFYTIIKMIENVPNIRLGPSKLEVNDWQPIAESSDWKFYESLLVGYTKTVLVTTIDLGMGLIHPQEYGYFLHKVLGKYCRKLNISLQELLGHVSDSMWRGETTIYSTLMQYDSQQPYTEDQQKKITILNNLCNTLAIVTECHVTERHKSSLLIRSTIEMGKRLGMCTFMQTYYD